MIDPERVLKSTKLPSLPSVAVHLLELSHNPDAPVCEFTRAIKTDPAISARILKAANSAYFGLSQQVTSVETAVPLLGSTVVVSLALSFSLIGEGSPLQPLESHCRTFWSRSLLHAVAAEAVARHASRATPGQCFLAGLLCDIGILAQINSIPVEYVEVLNQAAATHRDLRVVERERLGFDHVDIGISLMEGWKMPSVLVNAVRFHHASPTEIAAGETDSRQQKVVNAVRFATYFSEFLATGHAESHSELRSFGENLTGLSGSEFAGLLDEIRENTDEAARLMSINTSDLPRPADLLAQANTQLLEIALREHVAKSEVTVKSAVLELENRKLKQKNTELNHRAGVDALTGLYNRGSFDECFERLVDDSLRESHSIGVIFADIDNFKQLNDTYGHQLGDEVLKNVARIIKSQVRESDFVARYGGEEFVVITSRCPERVIAGIAERIRSRVESEAIVFQNHRIQTTVSVGVCVTTDRALPMLSASSLATSILQEADSAMYHCKRTGRNQMFIKRWDASIKSLAHNP